MIMKKMIMQILATCLLFTVHIYDAARLVESGFLCYRGIRCSTDSTDSTVHMFGSINDVAAQCLAEPSCKSFAYDNDKGNGYPCEGLPVTEGKQEMQTTNTEVCLSKEVQWTLPPNHELINLDMIFNLVHDLYEKFTALEDMGTQLQQHDSTEDITYSEISSTYACSHRNGGFPAGCIESDGIVSGDSACKTRCTNRKLCLGYSYGYSQCMLFVSSQKCKFSEHFAKGNFVKSMQDFTVSSTPHFNCHVKINVCTPGFCKNGGTCYSTESGDPKCSCNAGFDGEHCEHVHGEWRINDPYSTCSKTCGGGIKTKEKHCDYPTPQHGGFNCTCNPLDSTEVYCDGMKATIQEMCNESPCPSRDMSNWVLSNGWCVEKNEPESQEHGLTQDECFEKCKSNPNLKGCTHVSSHGGVCVTHTGDVHGGSDYDGYTCFHSRVK